MEKKKPKEINIDLNGMYKEYFLDYASYVILERAVPGILDGLKPVQRRILHSMKEMDDGRYNKVANIIGHTMQYHPHGDMAIGGALVNMGQKDLLIDTQGNWGDVRTGDSAAASRYIEARLSKFALAVAFNKQTTEWQVSYDGRRNEPVALPMKFPLVLTQGVEGIAVGLATKVLPHNFIELIKASIKYLNDKPFKLFPDFQSGGFIDVSEYNDGKRGGKVKVRAKIKKKGEKELIITELPYGVTTNTLIDSVLKANEIGRIKIKKITDNTAKDVEILINLAPGISPEKTIDALYSFTSCEVSISPNACIIVNNKPQFLSVTEILKTSTENTKNLLKQELLIKKAEIEEKWHMSSLEKIFIEKKIYRDIEECENFEEVIEAIDKGLKKYVATPSDSSTKGGRLILNRDITRDDIIRLTEIKIKKISKYNVFKAEEMISNLLEELKQVNYDLAHLTDFAIDYFERLLEKFGEGKERKTEITSFETIKATQVAAVNAKLYVNRDEGFVGMGIKKDEFVCDCSDIDDIIVFRKDGKFQVSKIADKVFMGKNIIHIAVWKKKDDRTTYNMVYLDGKTGRAMAKRFQVPSVTRDREYDLTKGAKGSKVLYFTYNPNGESEIINIHLSPGCKSRKKVFDFDFDSIGIKGRAAGGNILSRYPIKKINFVSKGKSSLGKQKIWVDEVSGRVNMLGRGLYLGAFDTGDDIIALYKDGSYEIIPLSINYKFEINKIAEISKINKNSVISAIYFDGEKEWTMVKRFQIETSSIKKNYLYISESKGSKLYLATTQESPVITYAYMKDKKKEEETINLEEFIDIKGWKAGGNRLGTFKLIKTILHPPIKKAEEDKENVAEKTEENVEQEEISVSTEEPKVSESPEIDKKPKTKEEKSNTKKNKPISKKEKVEPPSLFDQPTSKESKDNDKLSPGDTIEFDI